MAAHMARAVDGIEPQPNQSDAVVRSGLPSGGAAKSVTELLRRGREGPEIVPSGVAASDDQPPTATRHSTWIRCSSL